MRLALNESLQGLSRGVLLWRERLGGEALAAVIHSERAIQMCVDIDAGSGIAAST
ncbi:MAG: hypothetical protein RDU83_01855 [bacterium]|nr:hypothetical protein [bacterium]